MSAGRSFRSLFMAASCAGAALGCYLVSLRVASERAALEGVETEIVMAQRNLRVLQTELGTRGRLAQLERWNASALSLSAPNADQFLAGSFELARLARPEPEAAIGAPVVLASAPAPASPVLQTTSDELDRAPAPTGTATASFAPRSMMSQASLKTSEKFSQGQSRPGTLINGTREVPANSAAKPSAAGGKSKDQPVTAAKPAKDRSLDMPGLAAAKSTVKAPAKVVLKAAPALAAKPEPKKSVDKPALVAAKPVTKPKQLAKADPLAPLPAKTSGPTRKEPASQR
ncbi:MAG: hypothetical protein ABIO29_09080 [Sphingomicrobium sp.]